jgi:hypothetical protein
MTDRVRTYPELIAEKDTEIKRLNIVLEEKIDQIIDAEGSLKLVKAQRDGLASTLIDVQRECITLRNFLTGIKHSTDLALMVGEERREND